MVSSPVSKRPNPRVLEKLEALGHECAIAAPVWSELTYGCHRLPRGKRREALETYLEHVVLASFPVLAYDEAAARWHGIERARLVASPPGTSMGRSPRSHGSTS
ncbi:MAG: type II toxin-antitoxin system VapC family toxin [Deltaproteobacteria bacterium]|nr:type II toxin-antitoxin system VapC family toxin [Deltaproteobacteria bacterium]